MLERSRDVTIDVLVNLISLVGVAISFALAYFYRKETTLSKLWFVSAFIGLASLGAKLTFGVGVTYHVLSIVNAVIYFLLAYFYKKEYSSQAKIITAIFALAAIIVLVAGVSGIWDVLA